jgi:hypothetical protein
MEAYMQEALRNIHAEEARRITATLLTDVSVRTQRKMLDTRLRFLELERDEQEGEEGEDEDDVDEKDASAVTSAAQSTQIRRDKLIASKIAALGDLGKVFDTAVDPFACKKEVLASTLRDMMIADIVDLRQVLEQEAQQARKLKAHQQKAADAEAAAGSPGARQRKGASAAAPAGKKPCGEAGEDSAVVAQALAEAEERARLSLSEEIVDMLECKYGTAQHAGETASSLSGKFPAQRLIAVDYSPRTNSSIAIFALMYVYLLLHAMPCCSLHRDRQDGGAAGRAGLRAALLRQPRRAPAAGTRRPARCSGPDGDVREVTGRRGDGEWVSRGSRQHAVHPSTGGDVVFM